MAPMAFLLMAPIAFLFMLSVLFFPFAVVGALLERVLSHHREYTADRGAAILTGAPEQLMSALQKCSAASDSVPELDLRAAVAVAPFAVVATRRSRRKRALFGHHPPLAGRREHLGGLSRTLSSTAGYQP